METSPKGTRKPVSEVEEKKQEVSEETQKRMESFEIHSPVPASSPDSDRQT